MGASFHGDVQPCEAWTPKLGARELKQNNPVPNLPLRPKALTSKVGDVVGIAVDENDARHPQSRQCQRNVLPDASSSKHKASLPFNEILIEATDRALPVKDVTVDFTDWWLDPVFDAVPSLWRTSKMHSEYDMMLEYSNMSSVFKKKNAKKAVHEPGRSIIDSTSPSICFLKKINGSRLTSSSVLQQHTTSRTPEIEGSLRATAPRAGHGQGVSTFFSNERVGVPFRAGVSMHPTHKAASKRWCDLK